MEESDSTIIYASNIYDLQYYSSHFHSIYFIQTEHTKPSKYSLFMPEHKTQRPLHL